GLRGRDLRRARRAAVGDDDDGPGASGAQRHRARRRLLVGERDAERAGRSFCAEALILREAGRAGDDDETAAALEVRVESVVDERVDVVLGAPGLVARARRRRARRRAPPPERPVVRASEESEGEEERRSAHWRVIGPRRRRGKADTDYSDLSGAGASAFISSIRRSALRDSAEPREEPTLYAVRASVARPARS